MAKFSALLTGLAAATALSGCVEGVKQYTPGGQTVIATAYDSGSDKGQLEEGKAAIAYDPDGCQGWIIDDGVEGYSGRRFDPVTGLPICDALYPPGTVLKDYQGQSPGLNDYVPTTSTSLVYQDSGVTYWTAPQSYVSTSPGYSPPQTN